MCGWQRCCLWEVPVGPGEAGTVPAITQLTPCCARCSAVHKHQHPFPSTPWPTLSLSAVLLRALALHRCLQLSVQVSRPSTGHCSCSTRLPLAPSLQHKLQKSLAAAGVPFLLSLFVFRKPFCSVDPNYCPRQKSLGLVMSK